MYAPLLYSLFKIAVYKGIHYFLHFDLNIDCSNSPEPPHSQPHEAVLTRTHILRFKQKIRKKGKKQQLKIVIFTAIKIRSILHMRVIVMCNWHL